MTALLWLNSGKDENGRAGAAAALKPFRQVTGQIGHGAYVACSQEAPDGRSVPAAVRVAILAFPEVTASVVYGMYDILLSAGRDWGVIVDGRPGPSPIQP